MTTGTLGSSGGSEDARRVAIRACVRSYTFLRSSSIWYRLTCRGRAFFWKASGHGKGKCYDTQNGITVGIGQVNEFYLENEYFDV